MTSVASIVMSTASNDAIHPNSLCDREFLTHLLCHRGRYRHGLWKQGLDNSCLMDQMEAELTALRRIKLFLRTKRTDLVVLLSYILLYFLTDLHESTLENYNYYMLFVHFSIGFVRTRFSLSTHHLGSMASSYSYPLLAHYTAE